MIAQFIRKLIPQKIQKALSSLTKRHFSAIILLLLFHTTGETMIPLFNDLDQYLALDAPRRTLFHLAALRASVALRRGGPQQFTDMVRFAPLYRTGRIASLRDIATHLDRVISDASVQTVIDAGCGDGFWLGFFARRYPEKRFLGYDAASNAGEHVFERAKRDGTTDRVEFRRTYHDLAPAAVGTARADLLYAIAALLFQLPHSDDAITPDSPEWNAFVENDPEAMLCRETYGGFRALLRPGASVHVLENLCCQATFEAHVDLASRAGLRLAQHEVPVLEGNLAALRFIAVQ